METTPSGGQVSPPDRSEAGGPFFDHCPVPWFWRASMFLVSINRSNREKRFTFSSK
jgi:hypothetical protein